jgi:hypothetical protein
MGWPSTWLCCIPALGTRSKPCPPEVAIGVRVGGGGGLEPKLLLGGEVGGRVTVERRPDFRHTTKVFACDPGGANHV